MTTFPDSAALGDARAWLREQVTGKGARCPCCSQFAKVYRRKISAVMARDLVIMHRRAGPDWFHIPDVLGYMGGDAAKLRYWSLLEPAVAIPATDDADGNRRPRYRVTSTAREFITGAVTIPKYVLLFDGRLMGCDDTTRVSIEDCLGAHFHLTELLNDSAGEGTACAF